MTDFEKIVITFIGDQKGCNGRQEKSIENIKEDVAGIIKKLNGVDIHKLRDDVEEQNEKFQRITGAGALAIILVPLAFYFIKDLF